MPCDDTTQTLNLSQTIISFGSTKVGIAATEQELVLKNVGWTDIVISDIQIVGPFTIDASEGMSILKPGQKSIYTLEFVPTTFGTLTGSLYINAGNAGEFYIPLNGAGVTSNETFSDLAGIPIFETFNDLMDVANLTYPNGSHALVMSEVVDLEKNAMYIKVGDEGEGTWEMTGVFTQTVADAIAAAIAAEAAQVAAETAQTAAETAETNAAASAVASQDSADSASLSETASSDSATAAATSENNASTSETNAAASAAAALVSEGNAADSETAALASETAAGLAQTAAELAETNAETAQGLAEGARDAALVAQTAAELAETNAETAETNAETAQAAAEAALAALLASTGWGDYADTYYTEVSPLVLVGAASYEIPCNALAGPRSQVPADIAAVGGFFIASHLIVTGASGDFTVGETITGGTSGDTAEVAAWDSGTGIIILDAIDGDFTDTETITGGTSAVTATVSGTRVPGKITGRNGDGLNFLIDFKVKPTTAASSPRIDVAVDIGGAVGELYPRTMVMSKGQDVEHFFTMSVAGYTLDTWEANGGVMMITPTDDVEIYDIRVVLTRTHKSNL